MRPTELQLRAIFEIIENASDTPQFRARNIRTGWMLEANKNTAGGFEKISLGQRTIDLVGEGLRVRYTDTFHPSIAILNNQTGDEIEGDWLQEFRAYQYCEHELQNDVRAMAEAMREEAEKLSES